MATLVSLYGVALAPKVSYGRNNFDALSYQPKAPESPPGAGRHVRLVTSNPPTWGSN